MAERVSKALNFKTTQTFSRKEHVQITFNDRSSPENKITSVINYKFEIATRSSIKKACMRILVSKYSFTRDVYCLQLHFIQARKSFIHYIFIFYEVFLICKITLLKND